MSTLAIVVANTFNDLRIISSVINYPAEYNLVSPIVNAVDSSLLLWLLLKNVSFAHIIVHGLFLSRTNWNK